MSSEKPNTKHTKESIREGFILDFKGIFTIAEFKTKPLKPLTFKIATIVWAIFSLWTLLLKIPVYDLLVDMVNNLIIWIPCILGFTIGGFSFLIGFIQSNLMQKISEPRQNSPFSLFQIASAAFACNILIQSLTLAIAFVVHFVIFIDTKNPSKIHYSDNYIDVVNIGAFLLVGLAFALSLAVTVQIVVNVFNFSQLHHYNTNKEKLDHKKPGTSNENGDTSPTPD
jgi:hypothetical protein